MGEGNRGNAHGELVVFFFLIEFYGKHSSKTFLVSKKTLQLNHDIKGVHAKFSWNLSNWFADFLNDIQTLDCANWEVLFYTEYSGSHSNGPSMNSVTIP